MTLHLIEFLCFEKNRFYVGTDGNVPSSSHVSLFHSFTVLWR